jgi:predicted CXXCH cytochrome family protein
MKKQTQDHPPGTRNKQRYPMLSVIILLTIVAVVAWPNKASTTPEELASLNQACLTCHSNPGLQITLPSGENVNLQVNQIEYGDSVHGRLGIYCTACHKDITGFPHPPVQANTRREFSLKMFPLCSDCHEQNYRETQSSVHRIALDKGDLDAAECVDCHGSHNIGTQTQTRSSIAQTCRKCHSEIYDLYAQSVHGAALLETSNPDVPTCTDCHGTHHIEGPLNAPFRLFSPQICAKCHADKVMMDRYGLSNQVMQTYLSDFHGTTVEMFQATAPGQQTDKPVCIDCHSVHDIRKTNDPKSTVIKENILKTCQKCHINATTNFPASWLNHYPPSMKHSPAVFIVKIIYMILVPSIIGGMLFFVTLDYWRQIINRVRGRRHG